MMARAGLIGLRSPRHSKTINSRTPRKPCDELNSQGAASNTWQCYLPKNFHYNS